MFFAVLGVALDHGGDQFGPAGPASLDVFTFDFPGSGVRAFLLPPALLADLRRGTPGMGVAVAKALVFDEDPDILVKLAEETSEPPKLDVLVSSESVHEELVVDTGSTFAEAIAIAIMIVDLVTALRRDHPEAVRMFDLKTMVVDLLERVEGPAS